MKLHFDPNQSCQLEAIQSVTSIFEGQPLSKSDFEISFQTEDFFSSIQGVANHTTPSGVLVTCRVGLEVAFATVNGSGAPLTHRM